MRDMLQSFPSESFRDFGQGGSLGIRPAEPPRQVGSENPILGRQVIVRSNYSSFEARHKATVIASREYFDRMGSLGGLRYFWV
jgi:hypothetical protein